MSAVAHPPIVLASNRGPVSFRPDAETGRPVARRGAGGLVSGLGPLVAEHGITWIAAAMTDADREVATDGVVEAAGFATRLVDVPPETYRLAYDEVGNSILWYLHHHLWALARQPVFDGATRRAWDAFRELNEAFAAVIADEAPAGAVVLLQDYHLSLAAAAVRARRSDLRLVHFAHTPFGNADACRVLPTTMRHELLEGLAANDACGFHTERWAATFRGACTDAGIEPPATFVSPLPSDPADLAASAASPAAEAARADIARIVGDRRLVARVDRIELSKNVVRGFRAFDELLDRHPEWRDRVVFGAFVYPSREGVDDYLSYRQEVEAEVARINARWGTADWTPILYDGSDDYPRSIAALQSYDVLLVNPIRDGLNLVAKEGPLLNERDGVLLLSPEAGAYAELAGGVIPVDPYDVAGTAEALHRALLLDADERAAMAARGRALAGARVPADWLADQLAAAEPTAAGRSALTD